jgi:hypothetical protein
VLDGSHSDNAHQTLNESAVMRKRNIGHVRRTKLYRQ